MSDNKKYYYLKLKEDFFTSETIILLESMKDGVIYSNILLKLYLMSLKYNGKLLFRENIPYTTEMIATITRHEVGTIEKAIKIFLDLDLIILLENNVMYMSDIELFIGKSSTEAERKKKARLEITDKNLISTDKSQNNSGQMSDICPPEYRDKRIEIRDKRIESERENFDKDKNPPTPPILSNFYGEFNNVSLSDDEYKKLSEKLGKHFNTMINKLSRYIKSTGKSYKNHYATILSWYEKDKADLDKKAKDYYSPDMYSGENSL